MTENKADDICPVCRGLCGIYKPDEGKMGMFYPCLNCSGNGYIVDAPVLVAGAAPNLADGERVTVQATAQSK